ncbi:uncharacterized protein BO72DRAFT_527019 [Aspergillus fijiensis CBS 313.89]|uniref:Zn(2)-C6 fungal-type domain-containing protein n=1 Tax=Aspergillus fijiensis CBS 313.89 TaxID=1448319 RepID=A0A8G1RRP8_9EURO|nr:uncharacterized protein BO72DRAFT_527019 [Aspergillus fijiensis CBS 313.89]RAK78260.1 hypothetical protein BO72DRAFT_527019 [Aspergillus fijiensis CBS 313.89]
MSTEANRQQRYSKKRSATPRAQYAAQACQECRRRRAKCDGHKPSCARCLNRGMECVFNTKDDSRGTAPRSLVMQLQARIQQLEQVLWLHSIDVESSIAQLRAGHLPSISPSHSYQQSREEELVGALCANGPFGDARHDLATSNVFHHLQCLTMATHEVSSELQVSLHNRVDWK